MKDELLELINVFIDEYERKRSNSIEPKRNGYWDEKATQMKQVRSILEAHFALTEQDRKEAVEWIEGILPYGEPDNEIKLPRYIKTILRALGEGQSSELWGKERKNEG